MFESRFLLMVGVLVSGVACSQADQRIMDTATSAPVDSATASITREPLRALGTEPFWALDVDPSGLKFTTPDDTSGLRFPPLVHTVVADTVVWSGETERATITVRVWPEKCSDGMSDREYPFAARVKVAETEYRGCATTRRAIMQSPRP